MATTTKKPVSKKTSAPKEKKASVKKSTGKTAAKSPSVKTSLGASAVKKTLTSGSSKTAGVKKPAAKVLTAKKSVLQTAVKKQPVKAVAGGKKPAAVKKSSGVKPAAKSAVKKTVAVVKKSVVSAKKEVPAKKIAASKGVAKASAKKVDEKVTAKSASKAGASVKKRVEAPKTTAAAEKKTAIKAVPAKKALSKPTGTSDKAVSVSAKPVTHLQPRYPVIKPSAVLGKRAAQGSTRFPKGGKQRFSDADLEDFKLRLLERREEILRRQRAIRGEALSRADEENVEEDGTNTFTRTADLNRANDLQDQLNSVNDALTAIKEKTYGICQVCGCLITRDRLKSYPFAIRCVKCKTEYEAKKKEAKNRRQQNA